MRLNKIFNYVIICFGVVLLSCSPQKPKVFKTLDREIVIFPDYKQVHIPSNICPLNFIVKGIAVEGELGKLSNVCDTAWETKDIEEVYVELFASKKNNSLSVSGKKNKLRFNLKKWQEFVKENANNSVEVNTYIKINKEWLKLNAYNMFIEEDEIDPYIMYRYIQGSYEILNSCALVERSLTDFKERDLVNNKNLSGACINCHHFNKNEPDDMMFHIRFTNSGTFLHKDGMLEKINTATWQMGTNCIYPAWHPSGDFIAFSINGVIPTVYSHYSKYMEAFDTASDIAILDLESNTLVACPALKTLNFNETHPAWSTDGEWLYFARCKKNNPEGTASAETVINTLKNIKYDLMRAKFNIDSLCFEEPELVVSAKELGSKSVSLPRISPDGRFLMFCAHESGTFASWHRDSDLYMVDLDAFNNQQALKIDDKFVDTNNDAMVDATDSTDKQKIWWACDGLNSNFDSDSYHAWSSNSRWVIFASKREDGFYTRLYIGYVDENGNTYKPFLLPMENPEKYLSDLYLYNVCEFIKGPVPLNQKEIVDVVRGDAKQVNYEFRDGVDSLALMKQKIDASSGASTNVQNMDSIQNRHGVVNKGFQ